MDRHVNEDLRGNDVLFFGPLTLPQVKKININIMMDQCLNSSLCTRMTTEDSNASEEIIEICSDPELISISSEDSSDSVTWVADIALDNSFETNEKMVSNTSCVKNKENKELDNTLGEVENISNDVPCYGDGAESDTESNNINNYNNINVQEMQICSESINPTPTILGNTNYNSSIEETTPIKKTGGISNCKSSPNVYKSIKKTMDSSQQNSLQSTPNCIAKKKNIFKTPNTTDKTQKRNKYSHIISPVAVYIKHGPHAPLIRNVRPTKPMPDVSRIPRPIKGFEIIANKENINLPLIAYKSAKSVKTIKIPDEEKLPENQWAKKLAASLNKHVVKKHIHREIKGEHKREIHPDESFANLSLHEADLSLCTEKTAYNKNKKKS